MKSPGALLVASRAEDMELALRGFRDAGLDFELVTVTDGLEAIDRLLGGGRLPAVVLLDAELPRASGLDVLRALRADARTRSLPVVVMTATGSPETVRAAWAAGANSCVRKPLDPVSFTATIQQLGIYWLMVNEPSERGF